MTDTDAGRRAPSTWTRTIGDTRLTYLHDGVIEVVPTGFFTSTSEADWASRSDLVGADGYLVAGAGALLVDLPDARIVLDAGLGPVTVPAEQTPPAFGAMTGGALPGSCSEVGLDPARVDRVAFTHLHLDHVGWATESCVDGGRSLFPDASWLVGTGETTGAHCSDDLMPAGHERRTREVGDGEEVVPGVQAWSLPGHTSGHTAWVLDTGDGRRVIAFGDAMHSPAQIEHPEWTVFPDTDDAAAQDARRRLIAELSRPDTLGFGVHFADAQLGEVRDGRWQPV